MTQLPPRLAFFSANFNSHPHEEDDNMFSQFLINYNISTHILTKRMTVMYKLSKLRKNNFNSHPHEEDDVYCILSINYIDISTHILTKRMTA